MRPAATIFFFAGVYYFAVGCALPPPADAHDIHEARLAGGNTPSRVRLSYDASLNVVVTFSTKEYPLLPLVRYGTSRDNLTLWLRPDTAPATYRYPLKNYTSDYIGHCTLTGLADGARYYYAVESEPECVTQVYDFIAPVRTKSGSQSLNIAMIGDLGQTVNSSTTMDHVFSAAMKERFDALVIVGDMSYADSQQTPENCVHPGGCTPHRWDSWEDFFEKAGSPFLPTMVLPGNHEIETQDAPLEAKERKFLRTSEELPARDPRFAYQAPFVNYMNRFPMPRAGNFAAGDLFYSFDIGPAHFIFLNSYDSFVDPNWFNSKSRQFAWLKKDLAAVSRKETPWIIMGMHSPWYNSNTAHHNEDEETLLKELMEDAVFNAHVDLVFSGHVHAYERSKPVYKNVTTPGAPTYLNIGDGGNREGPAYDFFEKPEWSEFREAVFGHGNLMIYNATHAEWTWHSNLNTAKTTTDNVWFVKHGVGSGVKTMKTLSVE